MRILIHSNGPMVPSGYGQQVRQLLPRLVEMGHEPAVSAFAGLTGSSIHWDGVPVFPHAQVPFGVDVLLGHAQMFEAELVLALMDVRQLAPIARQLRTINLAAWTPVDCYPLSRPDAEALLVSQARPIAMSRFGHRQLEEYGLPDVLYVPHAVDTRIFKPKLLSERTAIREAMGVNDHFVVGIAAANMDATRKAWPEQFQAFANFHQRFPDTKLYVHSVSRPLPGVSLNLAQLAHDIGIEDHVLWSENYAQLTGMIGPEAMAEWYAAIDVLSLCSYGEGFGVPIIEAQACGTPVVSTNASAMTELNEHGWLVEGSPYWNPVHRAWWVRPDVSAIEDAYEAAYMNENRSGISRKVREFAKAYDTRTVAREFWAPVLEQLALEPPAEPVEIEVPS